MKHEIRDGIYYRDGKPVFALGVSYYPSFHKAKFQVPPEGDRIGEMKKDIADIKKCGFNYVRTAALGDISKKDDKISVKTEFIDAMIREAENNDLAASVRLQGYVMNLSGADDYLMINNRGEHIERLWDVFMTASCFHDGINKDNYDATYAVAEHFKDFPSVVSYQIYNEPHYPYNGVFDYHPMTIEAYKKDLAKRGIMTAEEAKNYEVPRRRPNNREEQVLWADWREFSKRAISSYLDMSAKASKDAADLDTYTCYTALQTKAFNANMGATYFDDAKHISTVGLTMYTPFSGTEYFSAAEAMAMCESAAALSGKRAWMVELDCRVKITLRKFLIETYATVGAGFKGINYYEWRGDYPAEGTPLPDNCGLIHYDRRPTQNLDEKLKMIKLINELSERIVLAERLRSGIAILHSDYAISFCDGACEPELNGYNKWLLKSRAIYKDLRKQGFSPDYVRSTDLKDNLFNVKYLFIPDLPSLSQSELDDIERFREGGGIAFKYGLDEIMSATDYDGYRDMAEKMPENGSRDGFDGPMEIEDVAECYNLMPFVQTYDRNMFCDVLKNKNEYIISVINTSPKDRVIGSGKLILNNIKVKKAVLYDTETQKELKSEDNSICLDQLKDGVFIICESY